MNKVKRLVGSFEKYIAVPWRVDAAAAQRVIFCVYDPAEEMRLRVHIDEFAIATNRAGHEWAAFDLNNTFAEWLAPQKYAKKYFEQPHLLATLLSNYLTFITDRFTAFIGPAGATENTVVALQGVGSLFGLLKVKDVVDALSPKVTGRLLVFFPGSYDNNNYRLLDGYDGWNYLAVPITADKEF